MAARVAEMMVMTVQVAAMATQAVVMAAPMVGIYIWIAERFWCLLVFGAQYAKEENEEPANHATPFFIIICVCVGGLKLYMQMGVESGRPHKSGA